MFTQLFLVALYVHLVFASSCEPGQNSNDCANKLPSLSPLEKVQGLLTSHMNGLETLLNEVMGLTSPGDDSSIGHDTLVRLPHSLLGPLLTSPGMQGNLEPHSGVEGAQAPLEDISETTLARPNVPSRKVPVSPVPPTWRRELYSLSDCIPCTCRPPTPNTSCCRGICGTALVPDDPGNWTCLGAVGVENAQGSVVPIEGHTNLVLLASFISRGLVHSLGFEKKVERWPADVPKHEGRVVAITGTIPLTIGNFTKAQLKLEDVFYVVEEVGTPHAEDNGKAPFPDLSIGVELLRQIHGLAVDPDVIV